MSIRKILILCFILIVLCFGFFLFILNREKSSQKNLESFYNLTLNDPLFYSSFFDSEDFEEAIKGLKNSDEQFRETLIKNAEAMPAPKEYYMQILKENPLFPFRFLENLILVNQKTKDFIAKPSIKLGQELLEFYDKTADTYLQDVSSKIRIFEESEKIEQQEGMHYEYFLFVDSAISVETVKNDYFLIQENGYKLKEEIEKRKSCLLGKEPCQTTFKNKDSNAFINSLWADFNLRGEKIDFIRDSLTQYTAYSDEIRGPYKIDNSSCWQSQGLEHWLYLIYFKNENKTLVIPKLATQSYYYKNDPGAANPVQRAFAKKGLSFSNQLETTYYECMDLTFFPKLLALDFLKKQIEAGKVNRENLEKESDYKLLIENQFGLMTPAINIISNILDSRKKIHVISKEPSDLIPLLSFETVRSIFYFPFSKSIWRIDEQPQYALPKDGKPVNDFLKIATLDDLLKSGYSKKEIKKFNINFSEFANTLLKEKTD